MHFDFLILIFIFLGLISGVLGGLLGIGGGVITVPTLYFIFQYTDMIDQHMMQVAVCTSLATSFMTAAVSTSIQFQKKAVVISALGLLIPGLAIGCITGSWIGHYLSSYFLTLIFGSMMVLLGIYFFFPRLPNLNISCAPDRTLSMFGFSIGCLSTLLGIGGGSMTFPVLMGYQLPAKNALATSSAATLVTTLIGTLTYLYLGRNNPHLTHTFGYIHLPAFFSISLGAVISTPFGVWLSHELNIDFIKRIFGCSLVSVGLSMLFF